RNRELPPRTLTFRGACVDDDGAGCAMVTALTPGLDGTIFVIDLKNDLIGKNENARGFPTTALCAASCSTTGVGHGDAERRVDTPPPKSSAFTKSLVRGTTF